MGRRSNLVRGCRGERQSREGEGKEEGKALVGSEGGGLGARMAAAMLWCRWPALPLPLPRVCVCVCVCVSGSGRLTAETDRAAQPHSTI